MGGEIPPRFTINISMEATQTTVEKNTDIVIKRPNKFRVVLHNDNTTPIEFVIELLKSIFDHNEEEAKTITTQVHNEGKGVAGIYYYEIAEQKVAESTMISRSAGYPLALDIEEV